MSDDFLLSYHGSLWLLVPLTSAAQGWSAEHLVDAVQPPWGGAVVIEPRYVESIVLGILDGGLGIEHIVKTSSTY